MARNMARFINVKVGHLVLSFLEILRHDYFLKKYNL
jgi:hypothetical protein